MCLIVVDNTGETEGPRTVLVIGPITDATISTLVSHLRQAPATGPTGQDLDIVLDLSCCTNLTPEGAQGLEGLRHEVRQTGGTLALVRVPALIECVLRRHTATARASPPIESALSRPEPGPAVPRAEPLPATIMHLTGCG